jgi:hypothetical protein
VSAPRRLRLLRAALVTAAVVAIVPAEAAAARVQVVVTPEGSPAGALAAVRAAGGAVQTVDDGLVQASVPARALDRLEAHAAVQSVDPPVIAAPDEAITQGLTRVGADAVHASGRRGAGVHVAVLDQAFGDPALLDAYAGTELPPADRQRRRSFDQQYGIAGRDVNGLPSRHGELVAEIVYDLAPAATYTLVNYRTHVEFGQAVDWLISDARPDIVVHSNSFLIGPFDGSGWFARHVDRASAAGILWVNSAGNYRSRHWEGAWTDADGDGALDVPGHGNAFPVQLDATTRPACDVSWTGPAGPDTGYELSISTDPAGTNPLLTDAGVPIRSSFAASPDPHAALGPARVTYLTTPQTFYLRLTRRGAPAPDRVTLFCRMELPPTANVVTSSVPTPGDARGALAVAAYDHRDFVLKEYSSEGPTDDGRGKPDLAAPSHVLTTQGAFGGTSSAAPHAAAAAALLWADAVAAGGPGGVAGRVAASLTTLALDVGDPGPDLRSGAGGVRLDTVAPVLDPATAATPLRAAGVLSLRLPFLEAGTIGRVAVTVSPLELRATVGADRIARASIDTRALADGPRAVAGEAVDRSGNASTFSIPLHVDNTPPALTLRTPRAAVLTGARVTVVPTAVDAGLGLAGPPTVIFGDGTPAATATTHRYTRPGVMTIAADARDVVGNVRRVTARLRVEEFRLGAARPNRPAVVVTLGRKSRVVLTFRLGKKVVRRARLLGPGRHEVRLGALAVGRHRVTVQVARTRLVRTVFIRRVLPPPRPAKPAPPAARPPAPR